MPDLRRRLSHMPARRGRQKETEYCRRIYQRTDGRLIAEPIGYSGNHDVPAPDFTVDTGQKVHAFELKTTGKDRISVYHDPDDRNTDDIHQLLTYAEQHPRTVVPHIAVLFTRRQLTIATLYVESDDIEDCLETAVATCETPVNATASNNLSFHRPATSEWPSAQRGDDVGYLLDQIGYAGPRLPPQ